MNKAFVDTTVLTNILLKSGALKKESLAALARFDSTELPVYAIKEFKAGPLEHFVYIHNVLFNTKSFNEALRRLQRLSMTAQRYKLSTSLEAIVDADKSISNMTSIDLEQKFGSKATLDVMRADEYRIAIKTRVYMAWRKRRKITTDVVAPLICYKETYPKEERGLIVLNDKSCNVVDCCMTKFLTSNKTNLDSLINVIDTLPTKNENIKRRKVLKLLSKNRKVNIGNKECRNLGDAIFALYAPHDCTILTTNIDDHAPLATCLGKSAEKV